jgi:long-subunit acyl-CoA synthetase (AMP-forming)
MQASQCGTGYLTWSQCVLYVVDGTLIFSQAVPWGWSLANYLVLDQVKESVGLSEVKKLASGGFPLSANVADYFMKYNMPIFESYGMTEASGVIASNSANVGWRVGSVGRAPPGTSLKLHKISDGEDGEVREGRGKGWRGKGEEKGMDG